MKNLKRVLIILALSFLFSCADSDSSDSSSDETTDTTTEEEATTEEEETAVSDLVVITEETNIEDATTDTEEGEIPVVVEPVQQIEPVIFSVMVDQVLYFYTGEFLQQSNVNPKNCGHRCFTDGATKVFYDDFGNIESTELLFMEPDFIVDGWIIENIEPAEALEFGARFKDYTRYYFQGAEYGNWFSNEYKVNDLIKTNTGEIVAISGNNFYSISDLGIINHADKLLIHEFDAINRTAVIDGIDVFWFTNYFNQAKQWQFFDGVWFSWNGYVFTDHLQWRANSLWSWNEGEKPIDVISQTVINAGVDENHLYFIECNTGWLISFNPEFDRITAIFQLYQGDGLRLSGIEKSLSLKPALVNGILYFNDNGLRKIDLVTGIFGEVMGVNGEVLEW